MGRTGQGKTSGKSWDQLSSKVTKPPIRTPFHCPWRSVAKGGVSCNPAGDLEFEQVSNLKCGPSGTILRTFQYSVSI